MGGRNLYEMKDIMGRSEAMCRMKEMALATAKYCPATILLGESGTGKELLAQAIHSASPRAGGPFVAVNCGAIPQTLLESELFGYEAGAFTGAKKGGHAGKFEQANGGTLFLDEIGDMPYEAQVSLLRVLQTREVIRVGGRQPVGIDIMVIAATHQDLEKKIREGTFREDLYYRLNVINLPVPALREREGDVRILSEYFLEQSSRRFGKRILGIDEAAMQLLEAYRWPGNVRELENAIARAVIMCEGDIIRAENIPVNILRETAEQKVELLVRPSEFSESPRAEEPLADMVGRIFQEGLEEKELLRKLLACCNGNLTRVAKQMGISRPTLYRKLRKYDFYEKMHQIQV